MRSTKFYPTKLVSSLVLLLLFMNVFSAFAQNTGPNITKPNATGCIDHTPGGVGSVYEYTYTGTGSLPVWTVRGDIQLLNGLNGTPVSSLSGPKAWIRSTANYGKGRLIVSFNQVSCGVQREYVDVYKEFSLLDEWPASIQANSIYNNIVGPQCVKEGSNVTYSINSVLSRNLGQEIGIDQYRWEYPSDYTRTYVSADTSSITLIAPATIDATDQIKVYVGKCNPVPYVIQLYKAIPEPVVTPLACLAPSATGTSIVTLSIQNPNDTEFSYHWSLPSNSSWQFTGTSNEGNDRNQVGIITDNTINSVTVVARRKVPVDGGCDESKITSFKINRSLPAGSKIVGVACVDGIKPSTYKVTDANNVDLTGEFEWTFTALPNSTGHGFSVNTPTGFAVSLKAGTLGGTLSVTRPGCTGTVASLAITSSPAMPQSWTAGTTCSNPNTQHVFTVAPVTGASSYTWTLGPGLTSPDPLVGVGNSIRVNVNNTSGSNVSVAANNGTCGSQALVRTITLNGVAPATVNSSKNCVNRGVADQITFTASFLTTAPAPAGQSYEWRVIYPTGVNTGWTVQGTSVNGSTVTTTTTPSITYVTNSTAGTGYRVEVRAVRAGCTPSLPVLSSAVTPARFIGLNITETYDSDGNRVGDVLSTSSIAGATYRWTRSVNGGAAQVLTNETGPTVSLDMQDINNIVTAQYCVTMTINGCTTNTACQTSEYNPTTMAARVSSEQMSPEQLSSRVVVFPNPTTSGEFTLQLPAFKGQAAVVLKNLQGQVVYKTEVSKTKSKLSAGKLTSGVYLLQVSLDGKVVTKKLTVRK